jgi:hypothetical protein
MKARRLLLSIVLFGLAAISARSPAAVELKQESNHIDVTIDGKPFTDYWFGKRDDRAYARPFFFPVLAPDGVGVTADHYGQKEHPHHNSLWVGHGDVNGADHWALTGDKTPLQRHVKFESIGGDTIVEDLDWEGKDHQPILHERRTMKFAAPDSTSRSIDFTLEFTPIDGRVTFGDTKEAGLVAVRMNDQIPKNHPTLTNSKGQTGEKATWGKSADWCDISGTIDGKEYGVSVLDAPTNPLHPQRWHVREYGLLAANPFGLSYFDKGVAKHTGDFVLPAGKTTTFHYLVIVHEGDVKAAYPVERYKEFAGN